MRHLAGGGPTGRGNEHIIGLISKGLKCHSKAFAFHWSVLVIAHSMYQHPSKDFISLISWN